MRKRARPRCLVHSDRHPTIVRGAVPFLRQSFQATREGGRGRPPLRATLPSGRFADTRRSADSPDRVESTRGGGARGRRGTASRPRPTRLSRPTSLSPPYERVPAVRQLGPSRGTIGGAIAPVGGVRRTILMICGWGRESPGGARRGTGCRCPREPGRPERSSCFAIRWLHAILRE
jgi:hypothetical protein